MPGSKLIGMILQILTFCMQRRLMPWPAVAWYMFFLTADFFACAGKH
jgi:hypothetical protein